ncbi:pyridoxal phosphate-dependent aminotransferase [Stakelama tenebrarum]|nr:histidinol-phosphate transaminase [Sphingosinithalassobacter tenebrarum]
MKVSRRGLLGAASVGVGMAAFPCYAESFGAAPQDAPLFGPAPGVALLSRNENPYGPAPSAVQSITRWADKGCYYADGGARRLVEMLSERFGVGMDHIAIGSGSTEILMSAALAMKDKGAIVCPELFWDATVLYAQAKGANVKRVPLKPDMSVDLAAMEAAVTDDVALVQICNPNNPTGMVLDGEELRGFVRRVSQKATVLIDEAYIELTDRPDYSSVVDLVKEGCDLIVTRTFSKIYGMAGLRVGYAVTTPENVHAIRGYEMSFGGNTAGLAAAVASYNDAGFTNFSKDKILEARGIMLDAVAAAGLRALPSQTNFLYVEVPDADAMQAAMRERGVMIRPAYGKWKTWSRASTGRIEDVRRYAAALPEIIGA